MHVFYYKTSRVHGAGGKTLEARQEPRRLSRIDQRDMPLQHLILRMGGGGCKKRVGLHGRLAHHVTHE